MNPNNNIIPTQTLSLYHTNIRSLLVHYDHLTKHLDRFPNTPDIITLTDNFLDKHTNPLSYPFPNYTTHHTPDVSVYAKNNLHSTRLSVEQKITDAKTIIIQIHKTKHKNNPTHTIINIYRRPRPNIDQFLVDLQEMINHIYTISPQTTITIQGDTNLDLLKMTEKLYNFLIHNALYTTITTPTRYDPVHTTTATLIDATLTTMINTPTTANTISPPITDHLPTLTIFHTRTPRTQQNHQKTLTTNRYNHHKHTILTHIKTAIVDIDAKPNTSTSQLFLNIQQTLHDSIEHFERKPKRQNAWITPAYKKQIQHQHKLFSIRKRSPTVNNIKKHARYRNKLNKTIKQAKRAALKKSIEATQNDPKQQAKILKSVIPSNSQPRTSPTTLTYENTTHTDPTKIANALNDHYITIGGKTAKTIPRGLDDDERENNDETDFPTFTLRHITEKDTENIMKNINPNKASDIYKIKPAIIKDLTPFLTPVLTELYNRSIDEQQYPDSLKFTKVIEVYKAKDKTLPVNYRPISLLPIIAKILDTLINNQLMAHLLTHNILSPTQYAFRPQSSTTLALQSVLNYIHKHKQHHKPTLAIYVDLSKAYDTISHQKLIHKLQHEFNFAPGTTKFFASYFTNRQQSTHTQHAHSETQTITHGIPQGSTLSTTFFLLYINNIIKTVPQSKVYTYADDTTLLITTDTIEQLEQLAQSELASLINYFHTNNLVPNPTKTNFTIFYPTTTRNTLQLHINRTMLAHNLHAKLLGIVIENTLKHNQTISNTVKKLQPITQALRYATKLLPQDNMIQLYYSHIYPHLIYSIAIWGSDDDTKTYLQPLTKMQKKIIRIIFNEKPRTHTKPLMNKHKILNITNLYTQRVCLEMHPFIHHTNRTNKPDHDHDYLWVAQIHDYPTRHSLRAHQFIPNPHQYSKTKEPKFVLAHLTQRYTEVWNKLPETVRQHRTLATFKRKLREHLLDKQKRDVE